ncbi:MAG: 5-formyltetrahydrofolate cyclo-ligase [Nitrospinota bacterium]
MHKKTSKIFIREKIRKIRESLDEAEIISKSREVEKNYFKLTEPGKIENLLIYMASSKEVQTKNIINTCIKKNIAVYLPAVDALKGRISFYRVYDIINNEWEKGPFGIYQPKVNERNLLKDENAIDLIVVPGLAFDKRGGRIGSGKGFYDKFLASVPSCKSIIALAFEYQIVDEITLSSHDIPMHKIITEKKIISCRED